MALTKVTTEFLNMSELVNTKTGATGTVTHDYSEGSIWYHSSISANFTANFTNVPTDNNRAVSVVLMLSQGGTAYLPTALEINSSSVTIKWTDASEPTGNANLIDVVSFTLIRLSSSWTAIATLSTFG